MQRPNSSGDLLSLCARAPFTASVLAVLLYAPAELLSQHLFEEVVVTAQRKEELLSRVPLQVNVIGTEELARARTGSISGLRGRIPGLLAIPHPNADTTLGVYLRGVGNPDEQVIQDPSVGVYVDGIYLPRNQGLAIEMADLQRVEVLRGPQGTLYGRNSAGGGINFVTHRPGDAPRRFTQQLTFGSRDLQRLRTTVDMPLGDSLAVAASYLKSRDHGFIRNAGSGASHFGSRDRDAALVDLAWTPADDWSVRIKLDNLRHADSPAFIDRVGLDEPMGNRPANGSASVANLAVNSMDNRGLGLVVERKFGNNTLKYIGSRRLLDDDQYQDYHSGEFRPAPVLVTRAEGSQSQRSHELQWLGSAYAGRLDYVAGYFRFVENAERESENRFPANNTARLVFGRGIANSSRAWYAQASWRPPVGSERLRLMAGGRYSIDDRTAVLQRASRNLATNAITLNPRPDNGNRSFHAFTPAAGLMFDLSERSMLYLTRVEGYKSGGFNARASNSQRFTEGFDAEHLANLELGLKAEIPALRSRLQLALFDTDYDQIQLEVRSNPLDTTLSDVLNAGDAGIKGFELELELMLHERLDVALAYSGVRAAYREVFDASGRNVAANYRFVGAPRHAVNTRAMIELGAIGSATLDLQLDYSWQDTFFSSTTLAAGTFRIPAYGVANASLQLRQSLPRGELRMAAWIRNATDREYFLARFNGGAGSVVPSAIWGEPRTLGLDIEYAL